MTSSNTTTLEMTSPSRSALIASFSLYVLPLVVGTAGNAGIVYIIVSHKSLRTGANVYIANMAALDLLACTLLVPLRMAFYLAQSTMDREGSTLCEADVFFHSVVDAGRMLFLGAISFERYQAVASPFLRDKVAAARRAVVTLAVLWVVMILYAAVVTAFFYDTIMFDFCMKQSSESVEWTHKIWGGIEIYFVLPLSLFTVAVVIVCYGLMFRVLYTHRTKMLSHFAASSNKVAPAPSSVLPVKSHLDPPNGACATPPVGICVTNVTTISANVANVGVVDSQHSGAGRVQSPENLAQQDPTSKQHTMTRDPSTINTGPRVASPKSPGLNPAGTTSPGPRLAGTTFPRPPLADSTSPGPHPAGTTSQGPHLAGTTSPGPHPAESTFSGLRLAGTTSPGSQYECPTSFKSGSKSLGGANVRDAVGKQDTVLTSSPPTNHHQSRSAARQRDTISFFKSMPLVPSLINENTLSSSPPITAQDEGLGNSLQKREDCIANVTDLSARHYQQSLTVSSDRTNTAILSDTVTTHKNAEYNSNAIARESVKHPVSTAKRDASIAQDSFSREPRPHQGRLQSETRSPLRTAFAISGSIQSHQMVLRNFSSASFDHGVGVTSPVPIDANIDSGKNSAADSKVRPFATNTSERDRQTRSISAASGQTTKATALFTGKDGKTRSFPAVSCFPHSGLGKARRKTGKVLSLDDGLLRSSQDSLGAVDTDFPARPRREAKGLNLHPSQTFCPDGIEENSAPPAKTQPSSLSDKVINEAESSENASMAQTSEGPARVDAGTCNTAEKTSGTKPAGGATGKAAGDVQATANAESTDTVADPQTSSVTQPAKGVPPTTNDKDNDSTKDVHPYKNSSVKIVKVMEMDRTAHVQQVGDVQNINDKGDESLKDVDPHNDSSLKNVKVVETDVEQVADPQNTNDEDNESPKDVSPHKKHSLKIVKVVEMDGSAHVEQVADSQNIQGAVCMLNPRNRVQGRRRVEVKVAKRLVVIFLTFLLLWLPYPIAVLALRLVNTQSQEGERSTWPAGVRQTMTDVTAVLSALTTVTAAVNPVFYGLANVNIRSVVLAKLKGVCKCRNA